MSVQGTAACVLELSDAMSALQDEAPCAGLPPPVLLIDAVTARGPAFSAPALVSAFSALRALPPPAAVHVLLDSTAALMDALGGPQPLAEVLSCIVDAASATPAVQCTVRMLAHCAWEVGSGAEVHEALVLAALGVQPGVGGTRTPLRRVVGGCTLAVRDLPTGYSKDVHGQLVLTSGSASAGYLVRACLFRLGLDGAPRPVGEVQARTQGDARVTVQRVGGAGTAVYDDEGDEG
jgi:hypothetical protein